MVNSFINEAGLTADCACHDSRGAVLRPSSCTTADSASRGTRARSIAAATSGGSVRSAAIGVGVAGAASAWQPSSSRKTVEPTRKSIRE